MVAFETFYTCRHFIHDAFYQWHGRQHRIIRLMMTVSPRGASSASVSGYHDCQVEQEVWANELITFGSWSTIQSRRCMPWSPKGHARIGVTTFVMHET